MLFSEDHTLPGLKIIWLELQEVIVDMEAKICNIPE